MLLVKGARLFQGDYKLDMNVGLGSWQILSQGILYLICICRVTFAKVRLLLELKYNFEVYKNSRIFWEYNNRNSLSSTTFSTPPTELPLKEPKHELYTSRIVWLE